VALGLMPLGAVSTFNSGFKKTMKPAEEFVEHVNKTANVISEAGKEAFDLLKGHMPAAIVLGSIGVGLGVAKGMGGIASRMMHDRQLNESFNTIVANNTDLKQIPNARAYYDVVARHSPSLAMDPMVAPQLIRQFDTFGGVDVNTVGKLREIEAVGRKDQPRGGTSALDVLSGTSGFNSSNLKNFKQKNVTT
jgi:xanthine dehydrogenase iron-sulfur cluster and FAD-binding subunit A